MIFFFAGTDRERVIKKSGAFLIAISKKRPDAEVVRLSNETWDPNVFEELVQSQGLFEQKVIVVVKDFFENKEAALWFCENADLLKESTNAFIFIDQNLDAKTKKLFEKKSETFEYVEVVVKSKGKERLNAFALSDAIGSRNGKRAWLEFYDIRDEIVPEEIHGTLWWQMKSIQIAGNAKSGEEAGLNPFVYQKSKRFAQNFKESELNHILHSLIHMYHEAHRGNVDLGDEIEKLILGL